MIVIRKVRRKTNVVNLGEVTLPPETAEAKALREATDRYFRRLVELSETMAGQILLRRKDPREVAITRHDAYRVLNGNRNKTAFDAAWKTVVQSRFEQVLLVGSENGKLYRKLVPRGVFGPIHHGKGITLYHNPKHDSADVLELTAKVRESKPVVVPVLTGPVPGLKEGVDYVIGVPTEPSGDVLGTQSRV